MFDKAIAKKFIEAVAHKWATYYHVKNTSVRMFVHLDKTGP